MNPVRRSLLALGGGAIAWLMVPPRLVRADEIVEIVMRGRGDGSKVWFDPVGVHVAPGTTIRWTNRDPGNAHTATAYHPLIDDRQRRIPNRAVPWGSDYLLPDENFSVRLTQQGVYDYYCRPHEHAGMVGRIVVGNPAAFTPGDPDGHEPPPKIALAHFPPVSGIVLHGIVRPE